MNLRKAKKRQAGFTIVEVIIVLAIVGVIILVVFLAVPAAQRLVRNNQRARDASTLASGILQFESDFGEFPNMMRTYTLADGTTTVDDTVELGLASVCGRAPEQSAEVKLSYYDVGGDTGWGHDAGPDQGQKPNVGANATNCAGITDIQAPIVIASGDPSVSVWRVNTDSLSVVFGETCNETNDGAGFLNPSSVAIFYVLEQPGSNGILKCAD